MQDLGKMLFLLGCVLVIAGAILWKTGGLGGLGQLPGDIFVRKGNSTFYFPIVHLHHRQRGAVAVELVFSTVNSFDEEQRVRERLLDRMRGVSRAAAVAPRDSERDHVRHGSGGIFGVGGDAQGRARANVAALSAGGAGGVGGASCCSCGNGRNASGNRCAWMRN
ncbi:MAG: DUF2905 domain-containing protein [Chthoniobacter sp.]